MTITVDQSLEECPALFFGQSQIGHWDVLFPENAETPKLHFQFLETNRSSNISGLILSNSVSPKFGEFENETNLRLKARIPSEDSILRSEILKSTEFKSGNLESYVRLFKLSFKPSFYFRNSLEKMKLILPADFLAKRRILFFMSKELSAYDFYNNLKSITCPVLVIHGAYDGMPLELSQKIQHHILNSKLIIIKDAGHFPFIDKPKKYTAVVGQFLKQKKV